MAILLSCGWSHTLGAELGEFKDYFDPDDLSSQFRNVDFDYRNKHRYSTLIAEKFDMQPVNLSKGGGSNERILRVVRDYLVDPSKELPAAVIIQWTNSDRFELPASDEILHLTRQRAMDLPDNAEPFEQVVAGGIYSAEDDMNPFEDYMSIMPHMKYPMLRLATHYQYKSYWHDEFKLLRQVLEMVDMLRVRNIPFYMLDIMWSWDRWRHLVETFAAIVGDPKEIPKKLAWSVSHHEDTKTRLEYYQYIQDSGAAERFNNLFRQVDSLEEFSKTNYARFTDKNDREFVGVMPASHPDEKCHQHIADTIYNEVKEKNLW